MKIISRYVLSLLVTLTPLFSASLSGQRNPQRRAVQSPTATTDEPELSEKAQRQMQALLEQKTHRTPTQEKVDPNLIVSVQQQAPSAQAEAFAGITMNVQMDERRRVLVDVRGKITPEVEQRIETSGGAIVFSAPADQSVRAWVPLRSIEAVAELPTVTYVESAVRATTHRPRQTARPTAQRKAQFKAQLAAALAARLPAPTPLPPTQDNAGATTNAIVTGPPVSQGDRAHQADVVRNVFGIDGTGVRIGVLSDSVRFLAQSQASKNLPLDVTVVPGQSGMTATSSGSGEGTAMLEIIHDLAPGAKLFFATAFASDASFAQNIRTLRFTYKCDIIVDDVLYFNEAPFQDTMIARAVNEVVADGALYFSSAGNEGNFDDGTGGVWEGDFADGGSAGTLNGKTYRIHSFGERRISNRIRAAAPEGSGYFLFWADPWGGSRNDYDLFILDSTLSVVKGASIGSQTGTQDPWEVIDGLGIVTGDRLVIVSNNAQPRALYLSAFQGELALHTPGQTRGHSSTAGALSVAAVNASVARGGAFTGGVTNPVASYSADGPRRIFFHPDGSPIVPGNFLFTTTGGTLRQKPDLAAADGVSTSVPVAGLSTFFGTSAAAPHAAAVAALLKSAAPNLTNAQLRNLLVSTALDTGPLGWDRNAGIGIVTALGSQLAFAPSPLLEFRLAEVSPLEGDGDRFVEPGETARLDAAFFNGGNDITKGLKVKLTSTTPGVTLLSDESEYFPIAPGKAGVNLTPLTFRLAESVTCGARLNFTATVSHNGQPSRTFPFTVQSGQPGATPRTTTYAGPPVNIPDGNLSGVSIRVPVTGFTSPISKIAFRINGDNCSTNAGTGLQHSWVGDLTVRLISPSGTVVTLLRSPGGELNFGQNFCNTLLDDSGATSIQTIGTGGRYSGTYRPATPLSAFIGENANGNWTLQVIDIASPDAGIVRNFSLLITTYDCARNTTLVEVGAKQQ